MNPSLEKRIQQLTEDDRKLLLHRLEGMFNTQKEQLDPKGSKKIVAYMQVAENFDLDNFKYHVKRTLPEYMVPSVYHLVPNVPLLPNGKADKHALKEMVAEAEDLETDFVAPESDVQKQLVSIWEEILNFSPISVHDNFFEIGGDSILSIQVISKARNLGIMLSANQLFEHQTIAELDELLSREKKTKVDKTFDYITVIRKGGSKRPLFCIHSGGGHVFFYHLLAKYIQPDRPIYAIQPSGLYKKQKIHSNIEEMTLDYLKAIKDIQPQGPYNVLVHCFSTSVGHEMAIQLSKTKEKINIIVADNMASPWKATSPDVLKVRIFSFIRRLFQSPLKTIKLFLQERRYLIEPLKVKWFGKEYEKELERLKSNLRKISLDYEWKDRHDGHVSLLLTDKPDEQFQNLIVNSWKNLALGGVKVYPTKGEHTTLFEEPDVQFVSEQIDNAMQ